MASPANDHIQTKLVVGVTSITYDVEGKISCDHGNPNYVHSSVFIDLPCCVNADGSIRKICLNCVHHNGAFKLEESEFYGMAYTCLSCGRAKHDTDTNFGGLVHQSDAMARIQLQKKMVFTLMRRPVDPYFNFRVPLLQHNKYVDPEQAETEQKKDDEMQILFDEDDGDIIQDIVAVVVGHPFYDRVKRNRRQRIKQRQKRRHHGGRRLDD